MKKIIVLPLLVLIVSVNVRDLPRPVSAKPESFPTIIEQTPLLALDRYKQILLSQGERLEDQGVLIESLDGGETIAEHNPDIAFNPASVMKLATSLVALEKFGPDYRYRTNILADGVVEAAARRLNGDLVIEGGANPMFSAEDAQQVAAQLSRLGISVVTGALRVTGPFYYFARGYHCNLSRETSAVKLREALEHGGIRIQGRSVFGERAGTPLLAHYSDSLIRILLYQNAHSSNAVAEVVGESLGGPAAIQEFLIGQVGLKDNEIYVGRSSGLEFNRITPRAALKVLRSLIGVATDHGLKVQDVMAVAGVDSGTLRGRLAGQSAQGAVIAKTGTLTSLDNGVSTLVGVAYTKDKGPLLFAILDSGGGVHSYRRLQDQFVGALVDEEGGPGNIQRFQDALADQACYSVIQVLYGKAAEAPEKQAE